MRYCYAVVMPKYLIALTCLLALAVPASASAAGISGSYSVTEGSAAAAWSFSALLGGNSDGTIPARLTSASTPDIVEPCDAINGMGTVTTRVPGVADAAARLRLAILLDVRRGVGSLTLYPPVQRAGQVLTQRITACEPPADAENGTLTSTFDATFLFPNLVAKPRPWTIKRGRDGAWTGLQTQSLYGQTQHAKVRLVGSGGAMNAGCRAPSAYEMRKVSTARGAIAFLASAGFTRPRTATRPSRTVPRGRYFVAGYEYGPWMLCGSRTVTLVKSSGRP